MKAICQIFGNHFAHPITFYYRGQKQYVERPQMRVTLLTSLAVGALTLGVGGVLTFYIMTSVYKLKKIYIIERQKANQSKSGLTAQTISSNISQRIASKVQSQVVSSTRIASNNHPQVETTVEVLRRVENTLRWRGRFDFHHKIVASFLRMAEQKDDLIAFVQNHVKEPSKVNSYLERKTAIVFHHEQENVLPVLKSAPDDYVTAYLDAERRGRLNDFFQLVFPANKNVCAPGNARTVNAWMNDLDVIPNVDLDNNNIYQALSAYFLAYKEMQLRAIFAKVCKKVYDYQSYRDHERKRTLMLKLQQQILRKRIPDYCTLQGFLSYMQEFMPFTLKAYNLVITPDSIEGVGADFLDETFGAADDPNTNAILQRFKVI